ncbi:LPXTG-motif cell wall-anchored protein [Microbacteriaceae bacterium SG_E_30_P1]|uniref:LPXTG-motif cell wall-anchored protein n=1 Tax=Antiquaquibacter oligotrophicus TaxID=2880260 RepID=A0ABT6KMM8_9MICO|nr:LPXTG cell wall anchor domain-containing protein [Antiquaquibacter oligotrophicus]MDH6180357.1 LPXTG-motif cell wall-anchored protein [Antiquaquibacter oligotrophicus]UDF13901.1 LPXTG cell wall anchor domain-containing protein [Antiquaquibacter oligotrophicus]
MRRRASAASSAAIIAALGLVFVGVSPAGAAELPETDVLHPITREALYTSTSTGASTFVADLESEGGKYGADYDPATGVAYYFAATPVACDLYTLDPATGASTLVGPVAHESIDECDGLNVALDGTLRIIDQDAVIVTVDKSTGAVLSSLPIDGADYLSFIDQTTTGEFYLGGYDGAIYSLDVATGVAEFIAQPLDYIETASFDSANTLWYSTDGDACQGLGSLDLGDPTGTATFQGDFFAGDDCLNAYAMFITQPGVAPAPQPAPAPGPQLAATGSTPTAVLPIAGVVLLSGFGALILARRARRA